MLNRPDIFVVVAGAVVILMAASTLSGVENCLGDSRRDRLRPASTDILTFASELHALVFAMEQYRREFGYWPDPSGHWFDEVVRAIDPTLLEHGLTRMGSDGGNALIDPWGRPVIYRGSQPGHTTLAPHELMSVGADGVDQHGRGDDFVPGRGFGFGYGSKRHYPIALLAAVVTLPVSASLIIVGFRRRQPMWLACAFLLAGAVAVGAPMYADPGLFTTVQRLPQWMETVVKCGAIVCMGAAVWVGYAVVRRCVKSKDDRSCRSCGYSSRGLSSSVCPECGETVGEGGGARNR